MRTYWWQNYRPGRLDAAPQAHRRSRPSIGSNGSEALRISLSGGGGGYRWRWFWKLFRRPGGMTSVHPLDRRGPLGHEVRHPREARCWRMTSLRGVGLSRYPPGCRAPLAPGWDDGLRGYDELLHRRTAALNSAAPKPLSRSVPQRLRRISRRAKGRSESHSQEEELSRWNPSTTWRTSSLRQDRKEPNAPIETGIAAARADHICHLAWIPHRQIPWPPQNSALNQLLSASCDSYLSSSVSGFLRFLSRLYSLTHSCLLLTAVA